MKLEEILIYRSVILDATARKRNRPTKFFPKSRVSQIHKENKKMTIPIKTISLKEHKMSNGNITGEFCSEKIMHD